MEIFNGVKKFKKEIAAIRHLSGADNLLSADELQIGRQKLLAAVINLPREKPAKITIADKFLAMLRQAAPVLLGLSLIGGTAAASGYSQPGQLLYPVKIATEKVRLSLASSDQTRAELQTKFAFERLNELKTVNTKANGLAVGVSDNDKRPTTTLPVNLFTANTSTPTSTPKSDKDQGKRKPTELQIQTRAQTSLEVNNAINALTKVKDSLETKGNSTAAAQISSNILKLQDEAKIQDIQINTRNNNKHEDDNQNRGSNNSTTTPPRNDRNKKSDEHKIIPPTILPPSTDIRGTSTIIVVPAPLPTPPPDIINEKPNLPRLNNKKHD